MSNITQRGATGPISLQSNGKFQTGASAGSTPGAYGTSPTYDGLGRLVGTRWDLDDGREVMLVSTSSATTATPGQLYQDAAIVANDQELVTVSYTAYSANGNVPPQVTVTLGGSAVTANQYAGGFVICTEGAGIGQTLRISSHPAQTATTGNVTIPREEGPNGASETTSVLALVPAHGANVIQMPTTPTNAVAGVALSPIAPSTYGFVTVHGFCSAVSDASVAAVGGSISPSVTTAGTVTATTATS